MALRRHRRNFATRSAYHTIPPIIPLTSETPRLHQHVSRSPVARRDTIALNPHGAATSRPYFRHTFCPHTTSNHITRRRQSSPSPATRRVYTNMFRAPQWHGATRTHFPPRPRKSAWHCDLTNALSPHALPTHYKQSYHTTPPTSDTPRLHQHVSRSPVARRHTNALSTKAAQIRQALRNHERNFATRSAHTLEAILPHDTANHPAHQRRAAFTPACFALPSGTAPRTRTSHQGRANRHHGRNFATRLSTHY